MKKETTVFTIVFKNGAKIIITDRCDYKGCRRKKTCFHYCHEHHQKICMNHEPFIFGLIKNLSSNAND